MTRILLIDDDHRLGLLLEEYFQRYDLILEAKQHPRDGLAALRKKDYDLVILDLMLPDQDGFEVCKEIRKTSEIPIIMLTARGEVMDRIAGIELGADDYLSKPFEPRELVVRIKSILRRANSATGPSRQLVFEQLCINTKTQAVTLENTQLELTNTEYRLLEYLASQPNRTLSRDDILNYMRGIDSAIFSRAVDITVSRLRQKLGDTGKPAKFIKTIWGRGYRFIAAAKVSQE